MTATARRAAFARVRATFEELAELPSEEREARLQALARDQPRQAEEVRSLFAAAADAPAFLDESATVVELEGRVLGAWRVEEHLASGGMGEVYRASRVGAELAWQAALKVLRGGFDGAALLTRFREERRTLAALKHPNIVALLDVGTVEDGRPYFVMELVDGRPIDRYCDECELGLGARLELFLTVCSAVEHAHRRLTAHCDLKPENVLVTREGHVKLVDFGIAELLGASSGARALPLTFGYASPEQVRGEAVGVATDVWSLSVLLLELASGTRAFKGATGTGPANDELARAAPEAPAAPSRVGEKPWASKLRGDFDAVVAKCLAPAAERRYASVAELAADVRAFLAGRPVAARELSRVERGLRTLRANPWTSAAVGVALASLALAAVLAVRELRRVQSEARSGWAAHAQAVEVTRLLEELLLRSRRDSSDGAAFERAVDAARVDAAATFAERPETLGRLWFAFAALYVELDRPEKACEALEAGLAIARAHRGFGREDVERAEALLAATRTKR